MEKSLARLRANAGKYIRVSARTLLNYETPDLPSSEIPLHSARLEARTFEGFGQISLGCDALVRKDIGPSATYKAYAEYFGINKVITLAWELIPFSFVVDWVTNAGEYIEKWTRLGIGSPFLGTRNLTAARTISSGREIYIDRGYVNGLGNLTDRIFIGKVSSKLYVRSLSIPAYSPVVDFSTWGSFQNVISGALLTQFSLGKSR